MRVVAIALLFAGCHQSDHEFWRMACDAPTACTSTSVTESAECTIQYVRDHSNADRMRDFAEVILHEPAIRDSLRKADIAPEDCPLFAKLVSGK